MIIHKHKQISTELKSLAVIINKTFKLPISKLLKNKGEIQILITNIIQNKFLIIVILSIDLFLEM